MYDFQPLRETSIRLLQIQPALRDGHISCILNQYDDHVPPYNALSYYWDDPKPTRKIYVNDSLVDIHEALWEFLDQSQRCAETGGWIWTDFLCLNQRDSTEMGHQVPRMGHIYSKAEMTFSWLGCNDSSWIFSHDGSSKPSRDLEQDFRLVSEKVAAHRVDFKSFSAHAKYYRLGGFTNLRIEGEPDLNSSVLNRHRTNILGTSSDDVYGLRTKPPSSDDAQSRCGAVEQGIINIFSMPYWTRAWVTQEVALAKEVLLMFGGASLDLEELLLAYDFYGYLMWHPLQPGISLPVPIKARTAVHEKRISFQMIMLWAQDCKATKVVDRIYGLLGILERCGHGTDRLPSILAEPIDYTRDWSEVYWEIILTYNPHNQSSVTGDPYHGGVMATWLRRLPELGQSLSCPFTRESLQYADNKRASPLCRNKARVALCVVDLCRQAGMTNMSIWLPDTITPAAWTSSESWPTKPCARMLWWDPHSNEYLSPWYDLQALLGTLFIETAGIQDMDEDDIYQAALIGLKMMRSEPREGSWKCVPNQSMERSQEYNIDLNLKCRIWMPEQFSEPPCSLLSNTSSTSSSQESHECQSLDRHLVIARTGWRLSLTDLHFVGGLRGSRYPGEELLYRGWTGVLNVKC